MKKVYVIIIPILLISIFGIVYYIDNPIDKGNSSFQYPYFLSVKPSIIGTDQITTISLQSLKDDINPYDFDIVILNPDGNQFNSRFDKFPLVYPYDFNNATNQSTGNYTIIVFSKADNNITLKTNFNIVTYPLLSTISNFVFTKGIAISFALVGVIVSIIYQFLSQRYQNRVRLSENKSKIMLENLKHYHYLHKDSWNICKHYSPFKIKDVSEEPDYKKFGSEDILYFTIIYCKTHIQFEKEVGAYYLGDYVTEQFIQNLDNYILAMINDMIQTEYISLKQFWTTDTQELLTKSEIVNSTGFKNYQQYTKQWLNKDFNRREYYKTHFVFSRLIYLAINDEILKTYENRSRNEKFIKFYIENSRVITEKYINEFNEEYIRNKELYYHLPKYVE